MSNKTIHTVIAAVLILTFLATLLHGCTMTSKQPESSDAAAGSRLCPIPVGDTAYFDGRLSSSNPYVLALALKSVIRGDEAWSMVESANALNEPPPDGMEYLLVLFRAQALFSQDDALINLHPSCFSLYGQDDTAYDNKLAIANLQPSLGGMYSGAIREGYAYFLVEKDEEFPLIAFLPDVGGGLWFTTDPASLLSEQAAAPTPMAHDFETPTPAVSGSRALPHPPKQTAVLDFSAPTYAYTASIILNNSVRGDKALEMADEADEFHPDPPEGMEYLFVEFTVSITQSQDDQPVDLPVSDFVLVSESGNAYTEFILLDGYDDPFEDMLVGQTRSGTVCFFVNEQDIAPLVVCLPYHQTGVWFAIE